MLYSSRYPIKVPRSTFLLICSTCIILLLQLRCINILLWPRVQRKMTIFWELYNFMFFEGCNHYSDWNHLYLSQDFNIKNVLKDWTCLVFCTYLIKETLRGTSWHLHYKLLVMGTISCYESLLKAYWAPFPLLLHRLLIIQILSVRIYPKITTIHDRVIVIHLHRFVKFLNFVAEYMQKVLTDYIFYL